MQSAKFCRATVLSNQPCNRGPAAAAIRDLLERADMPPDVIANLTACATALEGSSAEHHGLPAGLQVNPTAGTDDELVLVAQPVVRPTMPKPKRKNSSDEVSTAQLPCRRLDPQPSEATPAAVTSGCAQGLDNSSKARTKKKRSRDAEEVGTPAAAPQASRLNLDLQPSGAAAAPDASTGDQPLDSSGTARKRKKRRRDAEETTAAAAAAAAAATTGAKSPAHTISPAAPEPQSTPKDAEMPDQTETEENARAKKKRRKDKPVSINAADNTAVPPVAPQSTTAKFKKRKSDLIAVAEPVAEADSQPKKKKKNSES